MKQSKQRAVITITDDGPTFKTDITFEPSLKGKTLEQYTPSMYAGLRLAALMKKMGQELGQPIPLATDSLTKSEHDVKV